MDNRLKKNVISSILLQVVTIISGLIVPRIVLSYFGSEINGLTSSISQFLNYIQLMEGGLSGVIMASLYKPLANHDSKKVSSIIKATDHFFKQIAMIYIIYTFFMAIVYPLKVKTGLDYWYVFALAIVLGSGLFVQYFFSLTYRLLLNADRKVYIVSFSQAVLVAANAVIVIFSALLFKDILLVKLASSVVFFAQPIIYKRYVNKHYILDKTVLADNQALSQRWDGFGQNLAYFIHTNTDVVILTIFSTLLDVSVYIIYLMVIANLKNLVIAISGAISPSFGNVLASEDPKRINSAFDAYDFAISLVSTILFTSGIILVTPFVQVYTSGVNDANYYQPVFALIIGLAEWVYCLRDPFISACYASGHFRQTAKYAYIEAALNIIISIVLVSNMGIVGVAIGTLISMLYRMLVHVLYIKKNIVFRPVKKFIKKILIFGANFLIVFILSNLLLTLNITTFWEWIILAIPVLIMICGTCLISSYIGYKVQLKQFLNKVRR